MRQRTGSKPGFDYQVARDNDQWPEHILRTNVTASAIAWLKPATIIDPACGDGSIVIAADRIRPIGVAILTDISSPSIAKVRTKVANGNWIVAMGGIEAILSVERDPLADVVVLTEILEHVVDPVAILKAARANARILVASSPEMRPGQIDDNPEHLWQFDGDGFYEMLVEAGWSDIGTKIHLRFDSQYDFGIWVARQ